VTQIEIEPDEVTMVAVDISKHRNDLLIQPAGKKCFRMSMTNERVDHDRLIAQLHDYSKHHSTKQPDHARVPHRQDEHPLYISYPSSVCICSATFIQWLRRPFRKECRKADKYADGDSWTKNIHRLPPCRCRAWKDRNTLRVSALPFP